MNTKLPVVLLSLLAAFISSETKGQIKANPQYDWFKMNPGKTQNLFSLKSVVSAPVFSFKTTPRNSSILTLPLDNMKCLLPEDGITYHMRVFNPVPFGNMYANKMPNALPQRDLITENNNSRQLNYLHYPPAGWLNTDK